MSCRCLVPVSCAVCVGTCGHFHFLSYFFYSRFYCRPFQDRIAPGRALTIDFSGRCRYYSGVASAAASVGASKYQAFRGPCFTLACSIVIGMLVLMLSLLLCVCVCCISVCTRTMAKNLGKKGWALEVEENIGVSRRPLQATMKPEWTTSTATLLDPWVIWRRLPDSSSLRRSHPFVLFLAAAIGCSHHLSGLPSPPLSAVLRPYNHRAGQLRGRQQRPL